METRTFAKISAVCSVVFVGILVGGLIFIFSLMLMSGTGPFDNQPIKQDSPEEKKIIAEMKELSSVKTFKEIYPNFRENIENHGYTVFYFLQSRNDNTANIYSLNIQYQIHNKQFSEVANCQLADIGVNNNQMADLHFRNTGHKDLFLDATIRDSKCLDDDFYEHYPHLVQDDT